MKDLKKMAVSVNPMQFTRAEKVQIAGMAAGLLLTVAVGLATFVLLSVYLSPDAPAVTASAGQGGSK